MKNLHIGVDLGATWLRACLADDQGHILRRARLSSVAPDELCQFLKSLQKSWRLKRVHRLVVGSTHIWEPAARQFLASSLKPLAKRVVVLSDLELAHQAAFAGNRGIVIVAGTGSVAFGRDEHGHCVRAGGWGPLLGDEGSAFWIGKQALHNPKLQSRLPAALDLAHSFNTVRQTAALAQLILKRAPKDAAALSILNEAVGHLTHLVSDAESRSRFTGPIPVSWMGGLFQNEFFLKKFQRSLKNANPRFVPAKPKLLPEAAAALLRL